MPRIAIARSAAHAMLLAIEAGLGHSDDLLRDDPLMATMSDADRRLTTMLVLGVLRWQIRLDGAIRARLTKSKVKLDPAVLIALRLGAFQLLHLDRIPAHAAINESVELAKRTGFRSAAGLVNAVLRKIAHGAQPSEVLKGHDFSHAETSEQGFVSGHDSSHAETSEQGFVSGHDLSHAETTEQGFVSGHDFNRAETTEPGFVSGHDFSRAEQGPQSSRALAPEGSSLSAVTAHPAWLFDRWTTNFGPETACAICVHDQAEPSCAIRLSGPDVERELAESGITLSPGNLLTTARVAESGDLTGTAAFREGRVRIQDEGSQLIAELAAIAAEAERILDCCAAPGGKTMILAERQPRANIVACEASRPRLKQLRDRMAGMGERIEFRHADAAALSFDSEFDLVLADVPCSGTGTLGRNPEIRHRLQPEDLPRQAERQRAILGCALRAVRPGGRVVYSTCSLEPEENEQVIAAALAPSEHAHIVPLGPVLEALRDRGVLIPGGAERLQRCLTPEGFLRIIPGAFGTDGFFIAILERTPS
jgi:16S rRNA (cytosine967-C5)-methyltransferase